LPGYEIFKYYDDSGEVKDVKSRDLNAYIKEVMGPEFTPKDFLEQAEKNVLSAVDAVAERLGNTRDIARVSYISPRVIDHYMEGSVIAYYGELVEEIIVAEQGGLTEGEKALLVLLNMKLRREMRRAA
jgi:DNA topoisomerase-1